MPPSLPSKEPRRRGRSPKSSNGTWEDDDRLLADVSAIVGDRDERAEMGAEVYQALKHLADRFLGRRLTSDEDRMLRHLFFGTSSFAKPSRARGRRRVHDDDPVPPERASVIVRLLLVWRHNVTDPDVRWMQQTLLRALDPADRKKNGKKKDLTGQPIIRPDGRPVLDASGQSVPHKARPRVKMIFR